MASSSDLNKKFFGHCIVKWRIDHFFLQTSTQEWFLQSPEYSINGSEETRWCMNLRSELINGGRCVVFSLKRSASDSDPKYVCLNLKMCCVCSGEKYICSNKKLLSLKNGSKYEVSLGTMEYLFLEMDGLDDLFTIVCNMIVYSSSANRRFGECNHAGLKLLSENMYDLYRSAQNFDTKLVFDDNVILAHKAVLCARNEYLNSLIEEDDDDAEVEESQECTIIDFTTKSSHIRLDYKAMKKILAYLYTGNMRHVLEEPSFAIYCCAVYLEINEIEGFYNPDELILKSTIDLEQYTYALYGYDFENSHFMLHSDAERSMKTYELMFYPRIDHNGECIPLFTKTFVKPMNACLELDFVDEYGHVCTITLKGTFIDIGKIISGTVKKLHSRHNIFEIVVKLKLSADTKISYIEEHKSVFVSHINENFYYECLSADMEFLLDGGPFTDLLIDNNGTFFWVHKCILASRSKLFSNMLKANEEGETIVIPNMEPHIISTLLTYIYTGFLSYAANDDDDLIDVYKAAVFSNLPHLKSMCSDMLKLSCETNRSITCRVVRIAEEYKDDSLMKSVLNYLFDGKDIFLIPNRLSLQDVHTCRYCRSPF